MRKKKSEETGFDDSDFEIEEDLFPQQEEDTVEKITTNDKEKRESGLNW